MPRSRKAANAATVTPELDGDEILPGLEGIAPDPEPSAPVRRRGRPPGSRNKTTATRAPRAASGTSKASQIKQVRDDFATYLEMSAAIWSLRDPWCAESLDDEVIGKVADRLAKLLGRNTRLLKVVTEGSMITDAVSVLSALVPVAQAVWAAHGPGGHGHGDWVPVPDGANDERYAPYPG